MRFLPFLSAVTALASIFLIPRFSNADEVVDPTSDWPVHFDPEPPRPSPTRAVPPPAARQDRGYKDAMGLCDGIAVVAPIVLSGVFLAGQGALYFYAKVDTTFAAEPELVGGALAVSAVGYVVCGPATHIAHGHVDRAGLSLLARVGLPAAALGLVYVLGTAASAAAPPGDHFGPTGGEAAVGVVGALAILGAFAGAFAFDYGLASRPAVSPTLSPVAGGLTAGLTARW